jgi:hypothetical protein
MQQLTIITTYYNEKDLLERFVNSFLTIARSYPVKLIVIDDGSEIQPAVNHTPNDPNISLYKVKKNLGFNSHGARNLAMQQTTTDWNFLTDIDNDVGGLDFEKVINLPYNQNDVYSFHTNSIIINKQTYWSCKGYDEEFVGIHYGDRYFLDYLQENFDMFNISNNPLNKLRHAWNVKEVRGLNKDYYEGNVLYMKPLDKEKYKAISYMVKNRYSSNNFSNKTVINFEWELVTCS